MLQFLRALQSSMLVKVAGLFFLLLLDALLIFGMLAALMLVTRRVDWYALSRRNDATPDAPATQAA